MWFRTPTVSPPAVPSVGLLPHIQAILVQMDLRYQQRFDAQTKEVGAALQAAKEAVSKAETATERRFESVNEFRQTLADQARDLMPRLEAEQRLAQLEAEIATLRGSSKAGATALFGWIAGALGLLATLLALTGRLG